jgi:hypothetical protein
VLDGEVSCPERLDRRLRRRSDAASSSKVRMSVGTAGPGLRNWMLWISQLRIDERRFCDMISESPCISELAVCADERIRLIVSGVPSVLSQ